jgi:hypothetical protein
MTEPSPAILRRSPSGRLRLEISAASEGDGVSVCAMFAEGSGSFAWQRPLPKGLVITDAFVHDDGWVVLVDDRATLRVIDCDGSPRGPEFALIVPYRLDRHLSWSTMVRAWSDGARLSFVEWEGRPLFRVTTWWGRHVLLDVATGRAPASSDGLLDALDEELRAATRGRVSEIAPDDFRAALPVALLRTALVAGTLGVREGVPLLRALEASDLSQGEHLPPFYCRAYPLRQLARLSLRRLGEPVDSAPPLSFGYPGEAVARRVRHEDDLRRGADLSDAIHAFGAPERIEDARADSAGLVWEYDVDGADPATLQVQWRDAPLRDPSVVRVRRLAPRWLTGEDCFHEPLLARCARALEKRA